jgi:hypothetical protein
MDLHLAPIPQPLVSGHIKPHFCEQTPSCWQSSPQLRSVTMESSNSLFPLPATRRPWNKGKLIGPKPPLRSKHIWSTRTELQLEGRKRDPALFNLAIDSKLRGCNVLAIRVEDVAPNVYAVDRATVARRLHEGGRQTTGRIIVPRQERIKSQSHNPSIRAAGF